MTAHTPGPWKIGYGGQEGDGYAIITSPHSQRAICNLEPLDYIRANALLIVAAPEILARLKQALRYLEHPDVQAIPFAVPAEMCAENCRAAIAKAEGESE